MTWYNFIGDMALFIAAGWSLGTLIGYWERDELRGFSPKDKIWAWLWYEKEKLMWVWLVAIACRIIF
jgi:hypothetical protein